MMLWAVVCVCLSLAATSHGVHAPHSRLRADEDEHIGVPEALQLVYRVPESKQLALNQDVVEQLKQWPPCVILGVSGSIRTGKSFFANQLRGEQKGFHVGHTELSETEGLWIWGQPLKVGDVHVMLIDMEGFGGLDTNDTYETLLFSLVSTVSHMMVYHASDVDRLHISSLERFSRRSSSFSLHALSKDPELSAWLESPPGEDMPRLAWIVSRFTRELTKAPTDWLLDTIRAESSAHRVALDRVFPNIDCFTLPPPTAAAAAYRLDEVDSSALTEEFVRAMDIVGFFLQIHLKKDRPANVTTAARVIGALLESGDELPPAPNEWLLFEQSQAALAKQAAIEYFDGLFANVCDRFSTREDSDEPVPNPVLAQHFTTAAERAMHHLNHTLFDTSTNVAQAAVAALRGVMDVKIEKRLIENSKLAKAHLHTLVEKTLDNTETAIAQLRKKVPIPHRRLQAETRTLVEDATTVLSDAFERYDDDEYSGNKLKSIRKTLEDAVVEVTNANRMHITSMFDTAINAAVSTFTAGIKAYQLPVLPETLESFRQESFEAALNAFNERADEMLGSEGDRELLETGLRKLNASASEAFAQLELLNLRKLDSACEALVGQARLSRDKMLERVRRDLMRQDARVSLMTELRQQLHNLMHDSIVANARHYADSSCGLAFETLENMRTSLRADFLQAYEKCMQDNLYGRLEVLVDRFANPSSSPLTYPFRFFLLKTAVSDAAMQQLADVVEDESFRAELVSDWLYQEANPLSPLIKRSFQDLVWTITAIGGLVFLILAKRCASTLSL